MAQAITFEGEQLFAKQAQLNQALDIDTFVFANVPEQDPTITIDRNEGLPPIEQRVHTQIVQQKGKINDNIVVYSTVLESVVGPFEFNWVGLYSSVHQKLIAVQHIPKVNKTITGNGNSGNTLNRNFGIEYSGIAELTNISITPETWQLDFTSRLKGMDELTRNLASDMNGKDWFIDNGFKVTPRNTENTFSIAPGVGYVSGLRAKITSESILSVQSYPQYIYLDAYFDGNASSQWGTNVDFQVSASELDDYVDSNGVVHFVCKLAQLESSNLVSDLRNIEGLAKKIEQKPSFANSKNRKIEQVGLTIRQSTEDANQWYAITDSDHEPCVAEGFTIESNVSGDNTIRINLSNIYSKVVSASVTADETLSEKGIIAGASVDNAEILIKLSKLMHYNGKVYFDNDEWVIRNETTARGQMSAGITNMEYIGANRFALTVNEFVGSAVIVNEYNNPVNETIVPYRVVYAGGNGVDKIYVKFINELGNFVGAADEKCMLCVSYYDSTVKTSTHRDKLYEGNIWVNVAYEI